MDEELDKWRNRPLAHTPFVQLDAHYEKARHGVSVVNKYEFENTKAEIEGEKPIIYELKSDGNIVRRKAEFDKDDIKSWYEEEE